VPERLRKCIIENKDVTTAVACLLEVHLSYVLCLWFSSFIFSVLWPYILRCVKSLSQHCCTQFCNTHCVHKTLPLLSMF